MAQNPTRQVHALLAGFVQDTLIDYQNQHHKTDKIIARNFDFGNNPKNMTNQNACGKKTLPNKPER